MDGVRGLCCVPVRNRGTGNDGAAVCHPQRARRAPSERGTGVLGCVRFFPRSQLIFGVQGSSTGLHPDKQGSKKLGRVLLFPSKRLRSKNLEMPFIFLQVSFH